MAQHRTNLSVADAASLFGGLTGSIPQSAKEVKDAYRAWMKAHHPDVTRKRDFLSLESVQRMNAAYDVLKRQDWANESHSSTPEEASTDRTPNWTDVDDEGQWKEQERRQKEENLRRYWEQRAKTKQEEEQEHQRRVKEIMRRVEALKKRHLWQKILWGSGNVAFTDDGLSNPGAVQCCFNLIGFMLGLGFPVGFGVICLNIIISSITTHPPFFIYWSDFFILWAIVCMLVLFSMCISGSRLIWSAVKNFLSKHWRGEYSLPRSYWSNGVLFGFLLLAVGGVLVEGTEAARESHYSGFLLTAVSLYSVFYIAAGIWQTGGIWRSAKRRGGFWARAAKASIVIVWLCFLGNLGETMEHSSQQHPASSAPPPQPLIPADKPDSASNTEPWKQVGEWRIRYDYADSGDGTPTGCFMSRSYYNSALRLGVHGPNAYYLLFTSESLSQIIEDRKHYTLSLSFGKLTPWSITADAKSFTSGNKFLIFRISDQRFVAELVSSNSLTISQSGTPIFEFTVNGAKEALAAMLNCQESHRRNPYKSS